jgi:hypothetical protein
MCPDVATRGLRMCTQYATSEGDRESCEVLVEAEGAELED